MRVAFLVWGLAACASMPHPPAPPSPAPGRPYYDGTAEIDPATQRLSATWRITFVADSATAQDFTLLLNRGLQVSSLTGADVASHASVDSGGFNRVTVRLAPGVQPGRAVGFAIAYAGVPLFGSDSINGIRPAWIELGLDSFWHPVFSTFDQRLTSRLRIRAPRAWDLVASGSVTRTDEEIVITNGVPLLDVPFSAAPDLHERTAGTATVYHVGADSADVARVLLTTATCAAYLNDRYSSQTRLPHAKIVLAPRPGPGYARKNYVVISDVSAYPAAELDRYICHELAHFWSSRALSSGPDNWLNEGLAEFVAARFVRGQRGDSAYAAVVARWAEAANDPVAVWTPALTRRPGPRVSYRKAPHIMHRLEERVGSGVMDAILRRYMTESIASTPGFLSVVSEVAGAQEAAWLSAELARTG